jgi:hypothetical protein
MNNIRYLYWKLCSYALLAWECITVGPRQAWALYQMAKDIAYFLRESEEP